MGRKRGRKPSAARAAKPPQRASPKKRTKKNAKTRRAPMQAVFLDIDGVLLPFGGGSGGHKDGSFSPTALGALATILEACPRAELVLSSTWRCAGGQPAVISEFQAYAAAHDSPTLAAIKEFTHTTSLTQHDHRQWEVASWLSAAAARGLQVDSWVALDDEELVAPEGPDDHNGRPPSALRASRGAPRQPGVRHRAQPFLATHAPALCVCRRAALVWASVRTSLCWRTPRALAGRHRELFRGHAVKTESSVGQSCVVCVCVCVCDRAPSSASAPARHLPGQTAARAVRISSPPWSPAAPPVPLPQASPRPTPSLALPRTMYTNFTVHLSVASQRFVFTTNYVFALC